MYLHTRIMYMHACIRTIVYIHAYIHTCTHAHGDAYTPTHKETDKQTERDRQTGRQADRQARRETERQRDRETERRNGRKKERKKDFFFWVWGLRDLGMRGVGNLEFGVWGVFLGLGETAKARISCPRLRTTGAIEHLQQLQLT